MSSHRCYGASITKIFLLVDCELDIFMANPVTGLVGLWGSLIGFLKFSRAFTNQRVMKCHFREPPFYGGPEGEPANLAD